MRRFLLTTAVGIPLVLACSEQLPRRLDEPGAVTPMADASVDGAVDPPCCKPLVDAAVDATAEPEAGSPDACVPLAPGPAPVISFAAASTAALPGAVDVVVHDGKLYVVEQYGRLVRLNEDHSVAMPVLDIVSKVTSGGEAGFLGLAFHPQFATNGFAYLYYTVPYPTQPPPSGTVFQSALVRYHSNNGGLTLDPTTEKRILTIDQPYTNHNGGTIAFGNDGYLYWGLGDGGSGGDPHGNAQNTSVLLGKMLRIDVDGGDPYAIPPDNPFATTGGRPEIFAYGLRNPFRWTFDDVTHVLWVGDVGQDTREEIDKVALGGNYGWNIREGKICYGAQTCATSGFIEPVVDHPRSEANSITGGVVYRGTMIPALTGKYVYGDFAQQKFYAFGIDDAAPVPLRLDDGKTKVSPSAFALDSDGEILVVDYGSGIVKMVPGVAPSVAGCP